jgi:hypothetical protein
VRYRASNGVLPAVVLTEDEAREHFEDAAHVTGEFGGRFVVCPRGEMGQVLTVAATTYEPLPEAPQRTQRALT